MQKHKKSTTLQCFWRFFDFSENLNLVPRLSVLGSILAPFRLPFGDLLRSKVASGSKKRSSEKTLKICIAKDAPKPQKWRPKWVDFFGPSTFFFGSSPPFRSRSARDHSQIDFGPILVRFWSEFWTDFGGFLDRFGIDFGSICETTSSLHRDVTHV